MPSRRQFLAASGSTIAATAVSPSQKTEEEQPLLSFGLLADCQYADAEPVGVRFYRESPRKLREAITELNKQDLAFTLHLGDFIDHDFASFDALDPIAATLKSPLHHLLGNHDFEVADELKTKVADRLGLERAYYQFRRAGVRFLVLDTNEVSVYRHPADDPRSAHAREELDKLTTAKSTAAKPWNGRPGEEQLAWVEGELLAATEAREPVLVFGHHPILPEDSHCIWNWPTWQRLLQEHRCVKSYLNGHNHAGAYTDAAGLHYLTLDGMVDTEAQNAFAHARLFRDRLEIAGFGRQESHTLAFR